MFIETEDGVMVNAAEVTELRHTRDWKAVVVKMRGGETRRLDDGLTMEDVVRSTQQVIKADAGYFKLTFYSAENEEGEHFIDRQPIVAWRVTPFGLEPLTPDDDGETYRADRVCGVLYPDGRVNVASDRSYGTEAAWVAENVAHKRAVAASKALAASKAVAAE
jgi:hypothetical protein